MNKRAFGIVAASALAIAAVAAPVAAAPAEKTAWTGQIIVANPGNLDRGWDVIPATGQLVVNGNVWTLVASAEHGHVLSQAVVLNPASSQYFGGCVANPTLPATQDWESVTTPGGRTKLVCHGVVA
jgi:hypothetical protein